MTGRYRQSVNIASSRRELENVGTVGDIGDLRLRVQGTHINASVPIVSSYTAPPRFTGSVSSDTVGLRLQGEIKESFTNAMWTRGDTVVIVLLLACAALGVVNLVVSHNVGALWPLLIGALGAPAFGRLLVVHRCQRRAEWSEQSTALVRELADYLRGD